MTAGVSTPVGQKRETSGEVQQRGSSSNIAKRLKRTVSPRRAVTVCVSPYTNPGGRRGVRQLRGSTAVGRGNVHGLQQGVIDVVPLAVSAKGGDDVHKNVADAVKKDGYAWGDAGDAKGTTSCATVAEYDEVVAEQACRTTLSQFVLVYVMSKLTTNIRMQAVRSYLTTSLPVSELQLLKDLRAKCKKFKKGREEWSIELLELKLRHICADYLRGLIHVVPHFGAGDDADKYCIGGFAIDLYSGLLQDRQAKYPRLCWKSFFLLLHDKDKCYRVFNLASALGDEHREGLLCSAVRILSFSN
ncbi:hypothetical protein Cgig2_016345 [Carnegiea gigantea]|uniref:Uncharacterized protein n=1 Tax=Carnegiea gigantea TaxID=171969 RepID=A0A9Q1JW91_9CARY|nr:hypothetical protein Cgig2_016345 [Carnegiea gigantea]